MKKKSQKRSKKLPHFCKIWPYLRLAALTFLGARTCEKRFYFCFLPFNHRQLQMSFNFAFRSKRLKDRIILYFLTPIFCKHVIRHHLTAASSSQPPLPTYKSGTALPDLAGPQIRKSQCFKTKTAIKTTQQRIDNPISYFFRLFNLY